MVRSQGMEGTRSFDVKIHRRTSFLSKNALIPSIVLRRVEVEVAMLHTTGTHLVRKVF